MDSNLIQWVLFKEGLFYMSSDNLVEKGNGGIRMFNDILYYEAGLWGIYCHQRRFLVYVRIQ